MNFLHIAARNVLRNRTKTLLLCFALGFSLFITMLATTLSLGFVENAYGNISGIYYGNIMLWNFRQMDTRVVKIFDDSFNPSGAVGDWKEAIQETAERTSFIGRLVFNGQETTQQVFGVDWTSENILRQRLALKEGNLEDIMMDDKAIVISNGTARKLNINLGDRVLVMLETIKGQGNVIDFTVRGISHDIWIISSINSFAHQSYVNGALDMPADGFNEFNIILKDPDLTSIYSRRLADHLDTQSGIHYLGRRPLSDTLSTLGRDVRSEENHVYLGTLSQMFPLVDSLLVLIQAVSYLLMAIMLFITGVGIANSLQLIVAERTREIGTMRSIGAKKRWIRLLFLLELSIVAAIGVCGALLLYVITQGAANLITLGQDNSLFLFCRNGKITFRFIFSQQAANVGAVFLITLLAGLSPAGRAAELHPIEALRR